jgi:hypothetical protein
MYKPVDGAIPEQVASAANAAGQRHTAARIGNQRWHDFAVRQYAKGVADMIACYLRIPRRVQRRIRALSSRGL